ncbi:hypothetical protein LS482_10185 [Sinomicrobium kalidii]|uniref:hypothetical protein n=1 Tax=Sinomicrobium kalidii TaxID=2900738 RepID=UPI001E59C156|nr:hypothetical protein [Sinomicrobium kalidii]UGU18233.1 hypothetical protein LS482_10185 [Sinomicrobium kalidii]
MKILFTILLFAVTAGECDSSVATKGKDTAQEEDVRFYYNALSRGSFYDVTITREAITVKKSRNESDKIVVKTGDEDWKALLTELHKTDIARIRELKAPTDKRLYDGAAHAELIVTKDGEEYRSSGFDHGYPPEAIAPLVKTILGLAETVEKQ